MPVSRPYDDNGASLGISYGDACAVAFDQTPPEIEIDYWYDAVRICARIPLTDEPQGEWPAWYIDLEELVRGTMEQDRANLHEPGLIKSARDLASEFRRMADLIEAALPKS